jgi:hypothetical protein
MQISGIGLAGNAEGPVMSLNNWTINVLHCNMMKYIDIYCNTTYSYFVEKEKTSIYTLRLPDSLREELTKIAQEEERPLSNQIIVALRRFVKERK